MVPKCNLGVTITYVTITLNVGLHGTSQLQFLVKHTVSRIAERGSLGRAHTQTFRKKVALIIVALGNMFPCVSHVGTRYSIFNLKRNL